MKRIIILCMVLCILLSTVSYGAKFNMSYIYTGSSYTQMVDATKGNLNEVSPSYFNLNSDGSLKIDGAIDTTFISNMHERNVTVVPFLSNHWSYADGKAALNNREYLANQIVDAINKYDLDGVNVDIENVTEKEREYYTDFVRILNEKLPEGKVLAVAVAANPNGWNTGWHGSYDYAKLGEYADYLMLMTYDEHYEGGIPGAVMGYDFMEKSVQYALKYVPAEKLVLGIAFYGRYWNINGSGGRGVTYNLINRIFEDYTPEIRYDEESHSMVGRIYVSEEQANKDNYIFKEGTYDFWYDNFDTLAEKIGLVTKYNLKGTGSWALGNELPETWDYYNEWLNGKIKEKTETIIKTKTIVEDKKEIKDELTYIDVENTKWSYDAISFVTKNNLMIGESINKFNPSSYLTRAEAVTIISRLIQKNKMQIQEKNINIQLTDISNHWAKESILECIKLGIVTGYEDNTFKPNGKISREEIATMLSRLNLGIKDIKQNIYFTDVTKENWSYDNVMNMARKGILKGYEDNTFKPKNSITREEMAIIIFNICK